MKPSRTTTLHSLVFMTFLIGGSHSGLADKLPLRRALLIAQRTTATP